MKKKTIIVAVFASLFAIVSCKKDPKPVETPKADESEELITTLKLNFSNGTVQTFQFRDLDGDGGANGTIDTIRLDANTNYTVDLEFLNESVSPAEDITEEILEEANDHLICYTVTGVGTTITRADKDENNRELGIFSNWSAAPAGTGKITVSLKHQPGTKNGDCNNGSTDIEVDFPIVIK